MNFKECAREDVNRTFFNMDEFADIHILNGKKIPVIVDENELVEREKRVKSNMDGVYAKQIMIYVKGTDFGMLPAIGTKLVMDGKSYLVQESVNEYGVYSITLEKNKG